MTTPKVPDFGKDIEPDDEMIAKGKFGNGAYQNDESTLELVRSERKRIAIQRKEDRRAEYESRVVETLGDIADFQDALIQLGKKTALNALLPQAEITRVDLEVISRALKASDQVSNRILGLASRLDDKSIKQDALTFLIEGQATSITPRSDNDHTDD